MKTRLNCPELIVPILTGLAICLASALPARSQTWATNGPLQVARWNHTATLLSNNTVLIAGGEVVNAVIDGNYTFADTNAAELYNPLSGTSSLIAPMQDYRYQHRATLLPNGRVLISGGGGDASSEEYDPSSGTWIHFASMNDERLVPVAVLLTNGQVLAAGGYDDNTGQELSSAELYNPTNQTWTNTASMPAVQSGHAGRGSALPMAPCSCAAEVGRAVDGIYFQTNAAIYYPASGTWTNTLQVTCTRRARGSRPHFCPMEKSSLKAAPGIIRPKSMIPLPGPGHWSLP